MNRNRRSPILVALLSAIIVLLAGNGQATAETPVTKAEAAIRKVLEDQVVAWNSGRLEDFMRGYWQSEELTFFSGGRRLKGWEATIERYRRTYQAEGREMGKLTFSGLGVEMLGPNAALVRGEWHLLFRDGRETGGIYTLVFRRFAAPKGGRSGEGEWKIIHDHTSTAQ